MAIAGGFELALVCDLLVVAAGARFGLMEVKRGLLAAGGGLLRLPRQLPYRIAMELVLTGDPMTTEQLAPYGLFNRVVAPGSALNEALTLARTICANAPLSVASAKEVVVASADWPTDEMFDRQQVYVGRVMASADAREGPLAFAEKRAPVWTGK
jgi:enoyl-CoA hydratase